MTAIFVAAWRVMLKRVRASGLVLSMAFTTILLAITLLASGPIYANAVYLAALQRTVSDAPTREANLEITATLWPDAVAGVDNIVTAEIERVFGAEGVRVYRTGVSESYAQPRPEGEPVTDLYVFRFFENLQDHALLLDGEWPAVGTGTSEVSVAVPEGAALALGLGVGDELPLVNRVDEETAVTAVVSGVYEVDDPLDPYWYANELEVAGVEIGSSFTRYGPFVATEETFLRVFTQRPAAVSWRAVPLIERMTVEDVPAIRATLPSLEGRIESAAANESDSEIDARVNGGVQLGFILASVERSLLATRSGVLILTVQLAILAGYALVLSAGLLVDQRRNETVLLRSRGAGVRQMLALTLTARARSRDLSFLRTLGLSQPQALRLAAIEHIPSVIAASAIGAALGIAIVRLIEPGLDVSAFVGPDTSVPLQVDWLTITLLTIALTLVTLGAIALYTAVNRRAQLSQSLRVGDGG